LGRDDTGVGFFFLSVLLLYGAAKGEEEAHLELRERFIAGKDVGEIELIVNFQEVTLFLTSG